MTQEITHFNDWKTGEEKEYNPNNHTDPIHKTKLICPFDNTPIFIRHYYHNEHETFCPNCNESYRGNTQEEINEESKRYALLYKKVLAELERKKADLEARIKHAEEVGLISK